MGKLPILVAISSLLVLAAEASNPVFLFDKTVMLRRDGGLWDEEQRRILQDHHGSDSMARGQEGDKIKVLVDRALSAKADSVIPLNIFSRRSPAVHCDFDMMVNGDCSSSDFCASLVADPTTNAYCEGDLSEYWDIIAEDPEVCYYIRERGGRAFNESKFDAETDFCSKWSAKFYMNGVKAESYDMTVEISRPVDGIYMESNDLQSCEDPNTNFGFITGYCDSCAAVAIDGQPCNYCNSCPGDSLGTVEIDCSNIHSSLVMECENADDDIFTPFSEYVGAECTFSALMNGRCHLSKFCAQLEATRGGAAICLGDVQNTWSIELQRNEACFYEDEGNVGSAFDAIKFNSTTDYCLNTTVTLTFEGVILKNEEFVYELTRPMAVQGIVREASHLMPCDVDTPDYYFAAGYCYTGCPAVSIGDDQCNSECVLCPDGYEALDCSNVDSAMVENCSVGYDDDFVEDVAGFFAKQGNEVSPPESEAFGGGGDGADSTAETDGAGALEDYHKNEEAQEGVERIGDEDGELDFAAGNSRGEGDDDHSEAFTRGHQWGTLLFAFCLLILV